MNTLAASSRCLLLSLLAPAGLAQEPAATPPPANYVVHEWGTFTSMLGTNGISLDGLHHEEEHLPPFVHDLLKVDTFATTTETKLPASRVTQKLETPVIYFYTEEPMRVHARVWFAKGLMTQFYPLPTTVWPELADARKQRVDMSKVEGSCLEWTLDLVPKSQGAPKEIPQVAADNPWMFARQTGASFVRTHPDSGSPARPEAEHYVFYRGLGRWQPAVPLHVEVGGKATLKNDLGQTIPFCLALELGERGGRFATGAAVAPGNEHAFDLATAPWESDRGLVSRKIGAIVMQALVQQGLFVDEARAMVATWSRSWFEKDGARVIYVLPREQVDQVLSLDLQPRPKTLVRVLVGRLEYITPETQRRVEDALRARSSGDATRVREADEVFEGLDRFLEPQLRNVVQNGSSDELKKAAAAMLATVKG
jgi:hypothetical protein